MSTSSVFTWRTAGVSDCGPVRRHNEDSLYISEEFGLFVVADGMGGHAAGEVASNLAVEAISGFVMRSHEDEEYSWPYGIDPGLSLNANRLRTAVHLANRRVFREAESCDDYTGMGSTVVAALVWNDRLAIANIGDSRLYLLRGGVLTQLTQDDSWAALMLGQPDLAATARREHPMRNVLTKVLGAREGTEVHVQEQHTQSGDVLVLCSDGLHSMLPSEAMTEILVKEPALDATAAALVKAAVANGSRDNVTVLVAKCDSQ